MTFLSALSKLGSRLAQEGRLPPFGYRHYPSSGLWELRIDIKRKKAVELVRSNLACPRPYDGRTSAIRAYPLADEAEYVLGPPTPMTRAPTPVVSRKRTAFLQLLEDLIAAPELRSPVLRSAVESGHVALVDGATDRDAWREQVKPRDWVALVMNDGPLAGRPLFAEPEVQAFWAVELRRRMSSLDSQGRSVEGACWACGGSYPLARRLPSVPLAGVGTLASVNAAGFVSYVEGPSPERRAHVGCCFECAERMTQAFRTLVSEPSTRTTLVRNAKDSRGLANQFCLEWEQGGVVTAALVSPNNARIVVRDCIVFSAEALAANRRRFDQGTRLVGTAGEAPKSANVENLYRCLGESSPSLVAQLHRVIVQGATPSPFLCQRLLDALVQEFSRTPQRRDLGVIQDGLGLAKLILCRRSHANTEESERMEQLDASRNRLAYLSGRLLATIGELQRTSSRSRFTSTRAERMFGYAVAAPKRVLSVLIGTATTTYLKNVAGRKAGAQVRALQCFQELLQDVQSAGGVPIRLPTEERLEFALGFYQQRAWFRTPLEKSPEDGSPNVTP